MAKKQKQDEAAEAAPVPTNRAMNAAQVRVRALRHIAEEIGGNVTIFKPGDEFEIDATRRRALGGQVEDVKG